MDGLQLEEDLVGERQYTGLHCSRVRESIRLSSTEDVNMCYYHHHLRTWVPNFEVINPRIRSPACLPWQRLDKGHTVFLKKR
jgi:hypothetical protein